MIFSEERNKVFAITSPGSAHGSLLLCEPRFLFCKRRMSVSKVVPFESIGFKYRMGVDLVPGLMLNKTSHPRIIPKFK